MTGSGVTLSIRHRFETAERSIRLCAAFPSGTGLISWPSTVFNQYTSVRYREIRLNAMLVKHAPSSVNLSIYVFGASRALEALFTLLCPILRAQSHA